MKAVSLGLRVLVLVLGLSSSLQAAERWGLHCASNGSKSVYIFPKTQTSDAKVLYGLNKQEELFVSSFEALRCPVCYSFAAEDRTGTRFSGRVRGILENNKPTGATLEWWEDGKIEPKKYTCKIFVEK